MEVTIEVRELTKTYEVPEKAVNFRQKIGHIFHPKVRRINALTNVNFECREREIVGYLGPNGAGKSTTIKCLTGITKPTAGNCRVLGLQPGSKRNVFNQNIGVMFGQRSMLFWDISVRDTLQLYKVIYNLNDRQYERNLTELSEELDVQNLLDRPVRKLSFGQRVRCELVAALLHFPTIVFLDEPTVGVDLDGKRRIRAFLTRYKHQRNATIFLTTHQLDDIEATCDRILLLKEGQIFFDGTLLGLRDRYVDTCLIRAEIVHIRDEATLKDLLSTYTGSQNGAIELTVPRSATSEVVAQLIRSAEIQDLTINRPNLETVIAQWY